MPYEVKALEMRSAKAPYERTTITRRDPGPDEIVIDIKFAGICHSDIHTARGEWGKVDYPITPGHEIAGIVSAVGEGVTKFKVGDRAGVGCFVDSCGVCKNCRNGEENACKDRTIWTYNDTGRDGLPTAGGYSEKIVVREGYALHIPESIPLDQAAPLLCAGITPYSPLVRYGAGPGKKVAIVGLGGLGHMGVQLAHAMGAEVTVLSRSLRKKADGLELGADHYYATEDPETFKNLRDTFDIIISTVSDDLDVDAYVKMLDMGGVLCFIGMPPGAQSFHLGGHLAGAHASISGSNIGGIQATQDMLDFCAEHGIGAKIELINADEVTDAYDKVVAGKVHFRYVIDISTL
ncbi:MAG: NAD(P)-dependent alcohol dehydrogenase [Propionibacteriaceae bacterium]|jgi:uncharacterized zinc-type alcohol dehydrogenase-like protein|nr:NAD(P)-dependent alcohol dehydrogenase [Propionibacteriaceae bacterium]